MKSLEARIPNALYEELRREALRSGKSLQALVRESIERGLNTAKRTSKDPLFRGFPLVRKKDRPTDNVSERVDEILYGDPHGTPP
jgi:hypothetical protein